MAAVGLSSATIAEHLDLSQQLVCLWRQRYLQRRFEGFHEELRPGRPQTISDKQVATLVRKKFNTKPKDPTNWTLRSMASATHVSTQTVRRIWHALGFQPHRQHHFQLSSDPFFVEKVRDIVGPYLNPLDHAVTLCVDEKSQIQALDRTQPMLPLGLGYVEGLTHTYERHGTTTLFAALNIASGKVITFCKRRHRHQEYLGFLKRVDENVPQKLMLLQLNIYTYIFPLSMIDGGISCQNLPSVGSSPQSGHFWTRSLPIGLSARMSWTGIGSSMLSFGDIHPRRWLASWDANGRQCTNGSIASTSPGFPISKRPATPTVGLRS